MRRARFTFGEPEVGFALRSQLTSKATYTLPDGTKKQTDSKSETLVTQLEERSLDPALFEIPPGFKHEEHIERNPVASARSSQMKTFLATIDGQPGEAPSPLSSRCWSFWLPSSCRPRQLKEVTIGGSGSLRYNPSSACDRIDVRSNTWSTS